MQKGGELNRAAPLATAIKRRVRCTEAKLIWSFDDKRTTFILLSYGRDGRMTEKEDQQGGGENEKSLRRLENNNFCYIYVSAGCGESCGVPHFQARKSPSLSTNIRVPEGLSKGGATPVASYKVRLRLVFVSSTAAES